jgi:protein-S-isoprenylcysteine O-methyltransferase Ste14
VAARAVRQAADRGQRSTLNGPPGDDPSAATVAAAAGVDADFVLVRPPESVTKAAPRCPSRRPSYRFWRRWPGRHKDVVRTTAAAAGSAVFFALAPGTVAGLVPWLLTRWQTSAPLSAWWPLRVAGAVLILAGAAVLISAFVRFVVEGFGTPAPVAPTANLVVGGLYRYVRNPMYLAVSATILGQALLLWRAALLVYAAVIVAAFVLFVLGYEQPTLSEQFGASYEAYRRAVPGWWPRLRPWHPERDNQV